MQQHSIDHEVDTASTCNDNISATWRRTISNSAPEKPVLIQLDSVTAIIRYSLVIGNCHL